MNEWVQEWENKPEEIKQLTEQGIVPFTKDMDDGKDVDMPFLMGQVAGVISDIPSAKVIIQNMVQEAVKMLQIGNSYISVPSKL